MFPHTRASGMGCIIEMYYRRETFNLTDYVNLDKFISKTFLINHQL